MSETVGAAPAQDDIAGSSTRVKTPTVLQMQVTECGAAALAMVLAHYGRWVPLEELRERCGASRDGTTASDLVKAAGSTDSAAKGYSGVEALPRGPRVSPDPPVGAEPLPRPRGMDDQPRLAQRSGVRARRRIPVEEFDREYSKVCLTLRPTSAFRQVASRPARFRAVLRRGRPVLSEVLGRGGHRAAGHDPRARGRGGRQAVRRRRVGAEV